MTARDRLDDVAWYMFSAPCDREHRELVDSILAEHAHELAEQQREWYRDRGTHIDDIAAMMVADLIDPEVNK